MRNTFINRLEELSERDKNIFLLVGDLGYSVVDKFKEKNPDRYLNAGIAEQFMSGFAAGLTLSSDITCYTYSIANFPTLRCIEQIRNDICYHNANVKVVSVGAGVAYGYQGYSHFGVEDIAMMRTLPNITIASPADPREAKRIADLSSTHKGPWYVRLGRNGEDDIHSEDLDFEVGDFLTIKEGSDALILSTGSISKDGLDAAIELEEKGISVSVVSMPFLTQLKKDLLIEKMKEYQHIYTLEEHKSAGGLGSIISEMVIDYKISKNVTRLTLNDEFEKLGSQAFIKDQHGISKDRIIEQVISDVR